MSHPGEYFLNRAESKLSLRTILLLADQILSLMEALHSNGIILRVVDPRSLSIGTSPRGDVQFNMLTFNDLSLCKFYLNEKTKKHIEFRKRSVLFSSDIDMNFISLNALRYEELSRRDDIESLGYFMLHFFKGDRITSDSVNDFILFKENIDNYCTKFEIPSKLMRDHHGFC